MAWKGLQGFGFKGFGVQGLMDPAHGLSFPKLRCNLKGVL